MSTADFERLVELRRDLHRHPEPAWREFYTSSRIVEELERIGVDELYVGTEAIDPAYRWGIDESTASFEQFADQAIADGADPDLVDELSDGYTGIVAVLDRGEGPHVGLRVDIDALVRSESDEPDHRPVAEGFRSDRDGYMHACGHDGHTAIGIGVLEAIAGSDFAGRFTVGFQPAEEVIGGGKAMAEGGHFDDVDHLFAVHLGLDHPTGEVVAGIGGFLAVSNVNARFVGEGSHAGGRPELGRNAIQALAAAIQNLYGIARHDAGITRVNVGRIEAGTASNIIAEDARLEGEVRGGTTDLRDYMLERAITVLETAAEMHDCDVEVEIGPEAPSAESDDELAETVAAVAETVDGVDSIVSYDRLGGSEDATFLMEHVQERGGTACYVGIGTDHPGGHHTARFDVDEESIRIGVDVLTGAIREAAGR